MAQISGYLGWVLPANTLSLINQAIGPSPNIIWVAIAWTTGFAVGLALVGRLSDIFGRRWFFIGSSVLAIIGNIIGASAQSINMLIVCSPILTRICDMTDSLVLARQPTASTVLQQLANFHSTLFWVNWSPTELVDPSMLLFCLPRSHSPSLVLPLREPSMNTLPFNGVGLIF